jgi:hypothetical protein
MLGMHDFESFEKHTKHAALFAEKGTLGVKSGEAISI